MDRELKAHLEAMENRLQEHTQTQLASLENRLREHTEKIETQLLTQFWKWARTADIKMRQNRDTISLVDERIAAAVEDRVSELERRGA